MISEEKIKDYYFKFKNIIYIEKDEDGNIINTSNKDLLPYYDEIINSTINEGNQYYHIRSKKWYMIEKVNFYNDKTSSFHTVEYIEDISCLKKKIHKLKLDSLTGLMKNRDECNYLIDKYIVKALKENKEFSIVIGDIDKFKGINDTYGHLAGDFVLKEVAAKLLHCTNQSDDEYISDNNDIILRFGGDEFLILLKDSSLEDTINKIQQIDESIKNNEVFVDGKTIRVTMSLGYGHYDNKKYPNENLTCDEIRERLSKEADENLYNMKNKRNN